MRHRRILIRKSPWFDFFTASKHQCQGRPTRAWNESKIHMPSALSAIVLAMLLGQTEPSAPTKADDEKKVAAARLLYMKKSATVYDIRLGEEKKISMNVVPEPALRWNNPVSSVPDGALFLWVGPNGRPELAAQVFIAAGTKDLWLHEFQSLSTDSFTVMRGEDAAWQPRKAGIEMKPLKDAAEPADTPVRRLIQMRKIAQDFAADDDFEGKSRWELRLLTKPLQRYGKPDSKILDGALFVFAHGTDPEVFLMLEAQTTEGVSRWHYGLAPMTAYAVKASYKGESIWSRAEQKAAFQSGRALLYSQVRPLTRLHSSFRS